MYTNLVDKVDKDLKKYSKEELLEKAFQLRVATNDGNKNYPISWIRYDIAKKLVQLGQK
ncbi:hypothetical protein M3_0074 [Lysinibacillus phage vB_LfM_LysYB1]|nr:hypothetical protein M3_0074 [Lysinibacillus phage vB_LfM_LysYB1]WAB25183.1 hypothetical protein M5_0005 [Lysinibacillus phage vB_LfM_LysYB2]